MKNRKINLLLVMACLTSFAGAQKLTIDEAISLALKNNFDIRVAKNDAAITKANNTAGNAGMLPTVGISGSGIYGVSESTQKPGSGVVNNYPALTSSSLSAGLQLNWTLFDGGKMFVTKSKLNEIQNLGEIQFKEKLLQTLSGVISAYYDVVRQKQQLNSIREIQFKEKLLQTLSGVISAYYDVVRQKQQLNSIREILDFNRNRLAIAQAGGKAGTLLKQDLLQAKIDLNVINENAVNQQFIIEESLKSLNLLLGRKGDESIDVNDSISLNYTPDKAALQQKLNSANTSILSFQKQVEIAQLTLKENRSLYLPSLSVRGGYYASQTTNSGGTVLLNNSIGPQVGGSLVIPIYNAGETKRKETVAKIQKESAELDLQNIKLQLNAVLLTTLTEFENQQKLLGMETENNELARENLQISMERLKHGQTTSTEVHLAQENYVQSNTRLINFRYNLKMAETRLKQLVADL